MAIREVLSKSTKILFEKKDERQALLKLRS